MCIAAMAWRAHPRWQLVVAANRDEYHARAAAPLARWDDGSGILGGRDLVGGGTWLGLHEAGRFVLVTNFRVPGYPLPGRPSRGGLVTGLLSGERHQEAPTEPYNPFSIFAVSGGEAWLIGNHPEPRQQLLPPGIHGLSNGAYELPWPKTRQLGFALEGWLAEGTDDAAPLLAALRAETPLPSAALPDAGAGAFPEPRQAPVFIRDETYGTRCSTLVMVDAEGRGRMIERRFDAAGRASGDTELEFSWG